MSGSSFQEAISFFRSILTTPPISDCLWRLVLVLGLVFCGLSLCGVLDLLSTRRPFLSSAYIDLVCGPVGTLGAMTFVYWPLISEVL